MAKRPNRSTLLGETDQMSIEREALLCLLQGQQLILESIQIENLSRHTGTYPHINYAHQLSTIAKHLGKVDSLIEVLRK